MGAIAAWMYKALAGIQMDESVPAFKKITIKPAFIKELQFAEGYHESVYGTIRSAWKRTGNKVQLDITIPKGCIASVVIPGQPAQQVAGGRHSFSFSE
ncbi:alpha-L-rhamnosidase C-terminal domain-containing protein [Niabella hibiscisoli]|uniref:alpha-L-rhamnosidase C-terminal domain-containing protein n=1 Tax=Niabella hibiscisoli TaxID=1825928 RepID=UPI00374DB41B